MDFEEEDFDDETYYLCSGCEFAIPVGNSFECSSASCIRWDDVADPDAWIDHESGR